MTDSADGASLLALRRPPRLSRGDRVAVVAPSSPIDHERLRRGVAVIERWGLDVAVGPHALDRDPDEPHLAGRDPDRAADLQWAMTDPSVAAVICARGGSGAGRLIDRLDWAALAGAAPRVFVGFSDATALHQAIAIRLGVVTLFGPMAAAATFAGDQLGQEGGDCTAGNMVATREHLRRTLFEPETVRVLHGVPSLARTATGALGPCEATTGVTVGGTVSLLCQSVGTPDSRPARGGIAVLEDVAEPAYRLDGLLTHLLRSGWFDGVRGVVLGSWEGCGDQGTDTAVSVTRRLAHLGVPVVAGFAFGHAAHQLTVPLGLVATLDACAGTLTMHEPALAGRSLNGPGDPPGPGSAPC